MKNKEIMNSNLLKTDVYFRDQDLKEQPIKPKDLIQFFPYGMSVDIHRPFFILKDKKHELTLPVAINPLEAGVTLSQSNKTMAPATTHKFTKLLLSSLNVKIKKCVFVEIKGVHQYVRLFLQGHPTETSLKLKADEAMSLCIYLEIPIYATKEFISKSKVMSSEIEGMIQSPDSFKGDINQVILNGNPYVN